jgi:Ca-activated chloride channel family protein
MALLPLLLVLYLRHESRRRKLLGQLVGARLFDRLAGTVSLRRRRLRLALLLLGIAALITSLAEPRYGYTWEENKRQGLDVLVAIDCSRSMLATDLSPNRLERAKFATQDLIARLPGDRVGLIAFAGTAFLQAPLTIDYGAVLNSLDELDTDIIRRGGTNIAAAITEADAAFGKGESDNHCLILFTDGEELEADAVAAAEEVKDRMKIFTVGLGSADGSLIPVPDDRGGTTFVKDEQGQFVKSHLDESRLRKIAETTGGFYVHLQNGPAEMQQLIRDGLGQMKEKEFESRMSRRPIERYQWPLGAALVLLVASTLIGERKRGTLRTPVPAVALALIALLLMPRIASAKNSGLEAYDREDYTGAISEFDRQLKQQRDSAALNFDLGAAAYKSGDYDKALDAFSKAVTSPDPSLHAAAEYNLGNTLFQQGAATEQKAQRVQHWKDAIQHYEEALKVMPQNVDAEYNRDVVRRLLEEKEPPKQQQQQQQDKKNQDQKDQQQQQQQQQKSGGGQKNQDQQQNSQQQQQSQSQQSQGSSGQQQSQDQQNGSQQDKNQQGKDGQQKEQEQQQKSGNGEQKKDDKSSQGDQSQPQPAQGQNPQTNASPDGSAKIRSGEIQPANPKAEEGQAQKEAEAEAQAAQEGKMTPQQARSLLESLRGEDVKVQILKPPGKPLTQNFRNW